MEMIRQFFERAEGDGRLGPMHVSLFVAILMLPCVEGVYLVRKRELMRRARIGKTTYYKCLRELVEYGYIEYWPVKAAGESVVRVKC